MQNKEQWWEIFQSINQSRRAIRDFTGEAVPDEEMQAILAAAQLAPSSFNLQLYKFHWIKDPETCKKMGVACEQQQAALTAATFVVVEAQWKNLVDTYAHFLQYVDESGLYDEKGKAYYHGRKKQLRWLVRLLPLWAFSGLKKIIVLFNPYFKLAPLGREGLAHWSSRSSIYATQNLLLAAAARGIDTCAMEGFKPKKVAKLLGIKKSSVIPIVIALGYRKPGAHLDPQWRMPLEKMVQVH